MTVESLPFTVKGINHIGIATKNNELSKWFFTEALKLPFLGQDIVEDQGVQTQIFNERNVDNSDAENSSSKIELLESINDVGPIATYLDKKGGGIHHIAFEVDNLENAISNLKKLGIIFINEVPKNGAHNSKIAFIHPRSTGGILCELVEMQRN